VLDYIFAMKQKSAIRRVITISLKDDTATALNTFHAGFPPDLGNVSRLTAFLVRKGLEAQGWLPVKDVILSKEFYGPHHKRLLKTTPSGT
jgi:hypothetical protein